MFIDNNFISNMHIANSSWMQKYLKPQIHRLFNKVHSRRSIYAWNPYQASPTYIKASCQNKIEIQRTLYLAIRGNRETRNVRNLGTCYINKENTVRTNLCHVQYPLCSSTQLPTKKILWHTPTSIWYLLAWNQIHVRILHADK